MKNNIKIVFGMILCTAGFLVMSVTGLCGLMLLSTNIKGALVMAGPFVVGLLVFAGGLALIKSTKEPSTWKDPLKQKDKDHI